MPYIFTDDTLNSTKVNMDIGGPRQAYLQWHGLANLDGVSTLQIEDFAVAFYTAYNEKIAGTY